MRFPGSTLSSWLHYCRTGFSLQNLEPHALTADGCIARIEKTFTYQTLFLVVTVTATTSTGFIASAAATTAATTTSEGTPTAVTIQSASKIPIILLQGLVPLTCGVTHCFVWCFRNRKWERPMGSNHNRAFRHMIQLSHEDCPTIIVAIVQASTVGYCRSLSKNCQHAHTHRDGSVRSHLGTQGLSLGPQLNILKCQNPQTPSLKSSILLSLLVRPFVALFVWLGRRPLIVTTMDNGNYIIGSLYIPNLPLLVG